MGCLPHFVTHGAPLHASHARAPLLFSNIFSIFIVICFVTYWHIYLLIDSFTFCCVLMLLICCQDKNKKWKNIRARCLLCSFSSEQTSFYHILYLFDSCLFNASTAICFSISFLYLFALSPLPRTFQFLPLVFAAFVWHARMKWTTLMIDHHVLRRKAKQTHPLCLVVCPVPIYLLSQQSLLNL